MSAEIDVLLSLVECDRSARGIVAETGYTLNTVRDRLREHRYAHRIDFEVIGQYHRRYRITGDGMDWLRDQAGKGAKVSGLPPRPVPKARVQQQWWTV